MSTLCLPTVALWLANCWHPRWVHCTMTLAKTLVNTLRLSLISEVYEREMLTVQYLFFHKVTIMKVKKISIFTCVSGATKSIDVSHKTSKSKFTLYTIRRVIFKLITGRF